jgi:hypothetical protein
MNADESPTAIPSLATFVMVAMIGVIVGADLQEWRWRQSPAAPQGDVQVASSKRPQRISIRRQPDRAVFVQ